MRPAAVVVGLVASVAAIVALREATMSRHTPMEAGSVMEVVVEASSNDERSDLTGLVGALLAVCELEVRTDPLGPPRLIDERTYLIHLSPALDETDRRQMDGCIEDAKLDHLQARVLVMRALP